MTAQSAEAALWFLPGATLVSAYVAWSDLARMRIPNVAVLALLAVFAITGLFALPLEDYAWRWVQGLVMLLVGMVLNAAGRLVGAGDAKFIAAAAPYFAMRDMTLMTMILTASILASVVVHRIARATRLRELAPHWESWHQGRRFPMGVPLAATLVGYLLACVLTGP